jgi:hypothetical protein
MPSDVDTPAIFKADEGVAKQLLLHDFPTDAATNFHNLCAKFGAEVADADPHLGGVRRSDGKPSIMGRVNSD